MRRIAIINQKGGVGKTTTTANLGAALAQSGARVLLIDLDPQGHLTLHCGVDIGDEDPTIYDVLTSGASIREAGVTVSDGLILVPADIDLAAAESELISVTGREVLLREAVAVVADDFDYLLIDCPPSLGVLTVNALVACDEVVIPLQTQFFALQGLSRLFDTVTLVKQRINPSLTVTGVVLCMHESQTRLGNEVVDDLTRFLESARGTDAPWADARVFNTRIRRNIKLAEASSFGKSIFEYAPRSNGALDYADLTDEIFGAPAELVTRDRYHATPDASDLASGGFATATETETQADLDAGVETPTKPPVPVPAGWGTRIRPDDESNNGRVSDRTAAPPTGTRSVSPDPW